MDIRRFGPDDTDSVAAVVELVNANRAADAPFLYPRLPPEFAAMLRHGWDGEVPEPYAAWEGDRLVGMLEVHTSDWDNTHLAWLEVCIHPDARGEGRGSELLAFAEDRVRRLGRTSVGIDGWDLPHVHAFAKKHGYPAKGSAIMRRQRLSEVDRAEVDKLYDEALAGAEDYELLRIAGRTPDDLIEAVAEMAAAINDAPTDDLDIEDEVFPAERVAAYEAAQEARGRRLYRVIARHRSSGELAGHSVVCVEAASPAEGDQHDTSVVRAHRGHRLGVLVKTDMLRWLAEVEPQLETIDTWNAESNAHMIEVNERIGYEVLGRGVQFQRNV